MLLIGLAVGVDYSLFYLRRVREERAAGRRQATRPSRPQPRPQAAQCSSPASRSWSPMAGMYLAGAPTFTAWATGTDRWSSPSR